MAVRLGLRENLTQFSLLVAITAFVGGMVGLERSTLPLIGEEDFGLASSTAVLAFIVAFGLAKSFTNLAAGTGADRFGRRRLLILGWTLALPVPLLIALAPSWGWIVFANVLLGVNQGLTWSMTVVMKIDLVGPRRRGFALGLNEAAGYGGVAVAAALTGWLAAEFAARDVVVAGGAGIAVVGLVLSALFVRDTAGHVALEQRTGDHEGAQAAPSLREAFRDGTYRNPALRSTSQAGLVNNLNDALAWGVVPLFLASSGASAKEVGVVAGLYPAVWGVGQVPAGHWSDRVGRKPLIVAGMLLQAAGLGLLAGSGGAVGVAGAAAVVLGAGTALVYPTLIAAISDALSPVARASAVGVYRFWRDMGYVAGGLLAGLAADAIGYSGAIAVVAGITAASGIWVALDLRRPDRRRHQRRTVDDLLNEARLRLVRVSPKEAAAAAGDGSALLVDIRGDGQRDRDGLIPGAHVIARNVLEWRLDPSCPDRDELLTSKGLPVILICDEGYQSSLAAAELGRIGVDATDVKGGFQAWRVGGLPVAPPKRPH